MAEVSGSTRWWEGQPSDYPPPFREDRRSIEEGRLRALLSSQPPLVKPETLRRIRRASALLELGAASKADTLESWQYLALALEGLATLSPEGGHRSQIMSALAWQLGSAPAIATILADKVARAPEFAQLDFLDQAAVLFSRRDFEQVGVFADNLVQGLVQPSGGNADDVATSLEIATKLALGASMAGISSYVATQNGTVPSSSGLTDVVDLSRLSNNPGRYRVGKLLAKCYESFVSHSSQAVLEGVSTLSPIAHSRITQYPRGYPELWPSQVAAVRDGLLDPGVLQFVVSVPTSSGKTLCGELAIIQQLSDSPQSTCFYVVPTRALVTEKHSELASKMRQFGFRTAGATGALQRDEVESSLLEKADVIVLTPEKLDLLIRHNDPTVDRASIFVIDETHMISDQDRGLGIEFVVIKLLLLMPKVRLMLLSAMLPNAEQFGRWLSHENAQVTTSNWRPTRQTFASLKFVPLRARGCELHLTTHDPSGDLHALSMVLSQYSRRPKSLLEGIVLAGEVLREKGPLLVFCMSKNRCEALVEAVVERLRSGDILRKASPGIDRLRRKIEREIAPGFLLEQSLALRVAYHHADLPPRIRVDLENLMAAGEIDVTASTTTLAEGVNLPISSVLFEDWIYRPDPRTGETPQPLDLTKFRNIAGRAGRAGREAEGLVCFFEPDRENKQILTDDSSEPTSPMDYFVRSNYPPVQSRFLEIVQKYNPPTEEVLTKAWESGDQSWKAEVRRALRQFGAAVLHAMEVLDLDDDALIDSVIDKSLLAVQEPSTIPTARRWFRVWMDHYRSVTIARPELRVLAMQVGLPLRAMHRLYESIAANDELVEEFSMPSHEGAALTARQITLSCNAVASIQELDWRPPEAPHNALLAAWLQGATVSQLADLYTPFLEQKTRQIERTCNYTTQQLSNSGAWGMYALTRILELIRGPENVAPIAKRLPLFAYYGVDSTPAALLSLSDVERIDAIRLSHAFLEDPQALTSEVLVWARSQSEERITEILRGVDNRQLDPEIFAALRLP